MPSAVEELMRYVPLGVGSSFARYATEDVDLGGVRIRAGDPVIAALSSANRDGEIFDDPDQLDLAREATSHSGFGHGVHHCPGAQLARMELQVALGTLLARLPELDFACAGMAPDYFSVVNNVSVPSAGTVPPGDVVVDATESCPVEAIIVRDAADNRLIAPEE